jgi:pantoate--beta-alanine ligase
MPTVIREVERMQRAVRAAREKGNRVGVVPTMGALHDGHLSLIRIALEHAAYVVVSLFVNPTQFAPQEDLERYPRPFDRDIALATDAGAHCIFAPAVEEMYPPGFATTVAVEGLTSVLEGASRPAHFRGVTTIVTKLFMCTSPDIAVFGQKDGQQVAVIKRMVADLDIPVEIIVGPTVREPDGLALSSRNQYLSAEERREAPVLFQALQTAQRSVAAGERACSRIVDAIHAEIGAGSRGIVDYISVADAGTLKEQVQLQAGARVMISLAVRFGTTRLIDNVLLDVP